MKISKSLSNTLDIPYFPSVNKVLGKTEAMQQVDANEMTG